MSFSFITKGIGIKTEIIESSDPITKEIIKLSTQLLNQIINSQEFGDSLRKYSFDCRNIDNNCNSAKEISGEKVLNDIMSLDTVTIKLKIKNGKWNIKARMNKTIGKTYGSKNLITTYTYWTKGMSQSELIKSYTSHLAHELMHTSYFYYVHDPKFSSKNFDKQKDVCYTIGNIVDSLITNY